MTSKSIGRLAFAGAVMAVAAMLYPLYGDPRVSAVSHPEWARILLRALELDSPAIKSASDAFAALSWHTSLGYRGTQYERADAVVPVAQPPGTVRAGATVGKADYPLTVARGGDYKLRLRMAGEPEKPASAEVARRGETSPIASFSIRPAPTADWLEGGRVHLDPGLYHASVVLPPGASLERLEVAPPCVTALEPPGGWKTPQVATTTDVAVTLVKTLDAESELPATGAPIELPGNAIRVYIPRLVPVSTEEGSASGETGGVEGLLTFELPQSGVHTILIRGEMGDGQRWLADGCRKTNVCAGAKRATSDGWIPVLTSEFSQGLHGVVVRLGAKATVDRIRIERRRTKASTYVEAVKRLGLDLGPDGPISRPKAQEAMNWLKNRLRAGAAPCADLPPPAAPPPVTTQTVSIATPGVAPLTSGAGPSASGVSPYLPVAEVASPVR